MNASGEGASTSTGSPTTNPYSFTGREDDGTGLMYYRARYYHPVLGRFVSEDPWDRISNPNVYAYVSSNPILFRDPLGLLTFTAGVGGSLTGVTGIEGSAGTAVSVGDAFDIGGFGSVGAGTGLNVSGDLFVGMFGGDVSALSGDTVNVNVVVWYLSITLVYNRETGEFLGGTAGLGPGTPIGGSTTISNTGVIM